MSKRISLFGLFRNLIYSSFLCLFKLPSRRPSPSGRAPPRARRRRTARRRLQARECEIHAADITHAFLITFSDCTVCSPFASEIEHGRLRLWKVCRVLPSWRLRLGKCGTPHAARACRLHVLLVLCNPTFLPRVHPLYAPSAPVLRSQRTALGWRTSCPHPVHR